MLFLSQVGLYFAENEIIVAVAGGVHADGQVFRDFGGVALLDFADENVFCNIDSLEDSFEEEDFAEDLKKDYLLQSVEHQSLRLKGNLELKKCPQLILLVDILVKRILVVSEYFNHLVFSH